MSSGVWSLQAKYHTSLVNLLKQVCDLTMVKWGAQGVECVQGDKWKQILTLQRENNIFFWLFGC